MSEFHSFHSFPEVPTESRDHFWNALLHLVPREIVSELSEEQTKYLDLGLNDDFGAPYCLGCEIPGMGRYDRGWESKNGIALLHIVTQNRIVEIFNLFPKVAEIGASKSISGIKSTGVLIKVFNPDRNNGKGSLHLGDAENGKTYWF